MPAMNGPAMECLLKRPPKKRGKNEMNRSVCVRQMSHDSRIHQFLLFRPNIINMRYGNVWFNGGQPLHNVRGLLILRNRVNTSALRRKSDRFTACRHDRWGPTNLGGYIRIICSFGSQFIHQQVMELREALGVGGWLRK
jgi:hypothetical protein